MRRAIKTAVFLNLNPDTTDVQILTLPNPLTLNIQWTLSEELVNMSTAPKSVHSFYSHGKCHKIYVISLSLEGMAEGFEDNLQVCAGQSAEVSVSSQCDVMNPDDQTVGQQHVANGQIDSAVEHQGQIG